MKMPSSGPIVYLTLRVQERAKMVRDILVFVMVLCIAIVFSSVGVNVADGKYAMVSTGIGGLVIAAVLWVVK